MSTRPASCLIVALTLVAVALAGCHEPVDTDPEGRQRPAFSYDADEFAFHGPDELPAGWVELTIKNTGNAPHHIYLLRLTDGRTAADYRAAVADDPHAHPEWTIQVGGPNSPGPGGENTAIVFLEEGDYVMMCEIPDREGKPHLAHGMIKDIRVRGATDKADPPTETLSATLHDFSFAGHEDWTTGKHVVKVTNEGDQPHELVFVRYHEGGNFSGFLASFDPNATAPPPADFVSGITGIEPGATQFFLADITPGRYGFICFLGDPASGAPHFALGMEDEVEIQ